MSNGGLDALVQVQGPIVLEPATAHAYLTMKAAAAREGVTVEIPTPAGGYRSLAMQADMHANPSKYNLDPNSSVPLAPLGSSTHGWGNRVDIIVGQARAWAIENAARFGFYREFGDRDPGHFHYRGPQFAGDYEREGALMALSDAEQDELLRLVRELHKVELVPGQGYSYAQAANNAATAASDALTKPTEWTKPHRPIDVLVSHVKATLSAVGQLSAESIAVAVRAELEKQGVDYDAAPILEAISAATASINANIDDQPTVFQIRPA